MPKAARRILPEEDYKERSYRSAYVAGNAAPMPQPELPAEEPKRAPEKQEKPDKWAEYGPMYELRRSIDFVTMLMLCAALFVCAYTAIGYLRISSECIELDKKITNLTTEYNSLLDSNNNRLDAIVAETDFNKIYDYAVGKLGMVYPNENKIITFDMNEDGYVRQYAEIPELDEENTLAMENILNRLFAK